MNKQIFKEKQLKVQFAHGGNRNDRGDRDRQRDGYRNNYDRKFIGDRPKGCFNCGKDGHFAINCPQPRKPRQYNRDHNDRGGGYRRGGGRDYKIDERRSRERDYHKKDESKSKSRSRSNDKKKRHRKKSSQSRSD